MKLTQLNEGFESLERSGQFEDGYWVFVGFGDGSIRVFCPNEKLCGANVPNLQRAFRIRSLAARSQPDIFISFVAQYQKSWEIISEGANWYFYVSERYFQILKQKGLKYFAHIQDATRKQFHLYGNNLNALLSDAAAGGMKQGLSREFWVVDINRFRVLRHHLTYEAAIMVAIDSAYGHPESQIVIVTKDNSGHFIFLDRVTRNGRQHFHKVFEFKENQDEIPFELTGIMMQDKLKRILK